MSDDQLLYFAFTLFYLFDGIARLPREAWVFVRPLFPGRRWRISRPMEVASRPGEGYGMLPILGAYLPSGEGSWFRLEERDHHYIDSPEWSARVTVVKNPAKYWRDRNRIIGAGNNTPIILPNEHSAADMLRWLKAPADQRSSRLTGSLSLPRAKAALRKQEIIDRTFGFGIAVLTVYLFLVLPFAFSYYRTSLPRLALIGAIFPISIQLACSWRILYNRFFPGEKRKRWISLLPLILLPYHTLRMPRHLALNLTTGIHPLAMGKVLLEPDTFLAFADEYMRRLRYPLTLAVPPGIWENSYERCAAFLANDCQLKTSEWEETSPVLDRDSESYCPRCHTQFLIPKAVCGTCGDLASIAIPGRAE